MIKRTSIFITILAVLSCTSCQLGRSIFYNYADIDDHEIFPARKIEKGDATFTFPKAHQPKAPKAYTNHETGEELAFDDFLEQNQTVSFLIIQNDSIQYENYFDDYHQESIVASFSMAKSVLSMLVGIAIEEGYISSVKDSIGKYITDLKDDEVKNVTIEQLLQMTSGIEFSESYNKPFTDAAAFYYGQNLEKKTKRIHLKEPTNTEFEYTSGSSQLLGLVLTNALSGKSISGYLEEKIWKPLDMQYDASWSIDEKEGIEKTFCCLNARALDYAKLGRLYLNKGNYNGQQIITKEWIERSTKIDTTGNSVHYYQYQWWLPTGTGDFMAQGLLGQYIYVNPEKNLIVVRLGKEEGDVDWFELLPNLASNYESI